MMCMFRNRDWESKPPTFNDVLVVLGTIREYYVFHPPRQGATSDEKSSMERLRQFLFFFVSDFGLAFPGPYEYECETHLLWEYGACCILNSKKNVRLCLCLDCFPLLPNIDIRTGTGCACTRM